jgi:hypothetical protein
MAMFDKMGLVVAGAAMSTGACGGTCDPFPWAALMAWNL